MITKQVDCDCGASIRKDGDDELVKAVQKHAEEVHDMKLTREQVLSMARPLAPYDREGGRGPREK